ncbi:Hcp family type VI secretion system effector [Marinimicrobium alkaliphilum]|uniref:Hcp family type VI secretion system effector n=1 Tax=Marinimicrobium alkaliphilum TaxID=2202654 RepID=UPI000DBAA124|nr:type VI secretion system tube protein Hcp [Marinimicrobium alkaliphilum]
MAIYLEYEGVKGNVTAEGYKDHIAVQSLNFGIGRGISMEPGNLANREATRPTLSEINLTKVADNSATALFKEAVTGSAGKKVTIKFVQTGADKVVEYMDYVLEDCLVSGYQISGSEDGDPVETISLSYSKIMVNYNDFDKSNKSSNPQRVGYDLTTAKPL